MRDTERDPAVTDPFQVGGGDRRTTKTIPIRIMPIVRFVLAVFAGFAPVIHNMMLTGVNMTGMQSFQSTRLRSGTFHHEPIMDRTSVRHALGIQIENGNREIGFDDQTYPGGLTYLEQRLARLSQK